MQEVVLLMALQKNIDNIVVQYITGCHVECEGRAQNTAQTAYMCTYAYNQPTLLTRNHLLGLYLLSV